MTNTVSFLLDVQWYSMFFLGVGEVVVTIFLVRVVRTLNALMRLPGNEVLSKRSTDGGRRQFNSDKQWKVCTLELMILKTLTQFEYIS